LNFRLKQGQTKERSLTENPCNSYNKTIESSSNGIKPSLNYNSLVPYIDSDKDDSDDENSSLSGEDNVSSPVILGKVKHSTDQRVPDKKPLVMRPKEDPCGEVGIETPPKKCLVLKPPNDDSSINEREKEILPAKKCLVLKPKDEEPLEDKPESEPVKKCLVRIPKDDNESNISKVPYSTEVKDSEKKNRKRENGILELDSSKPKARLDHSYNGLVV